jgi:hypothetical protein
VYEGLKRTVKRVINALYFSLGRSPMDLFIEVVMGSGNNV